ncbi:MAG TPA: hypothetical protein VEH75_04310 [Xanthobacteraceae bacterium]|nr:hypothetical protein [Xanthobacteraceae bacterium]
MAQLAERNPLGRNALYIAAAFVGLGLAAALLLWARLGTAVFFESIRAGLAYCFG